MNLPPGLHLSRTDRSIGGVLSAVGSLLQALGGERGDQAPLADTIEESPAPMMPMMLPPSAVPPTRTRADAPRVAGIGAPDPVDEVSALLADARARAQAIMDKSMARAEELLRPPAEPPEQQTLDRIRRTVADIATDVRALHSRLDDIEALVRGQSAQRLSFAAPPTPPTPAAPATWPTSLAFGSTPAATPAPEPPAFGSMPPSTPTSTPAPEPPAFGSMQTSTPPPAPEPAPAPVPTPAPAPPPPLLPTSWAGLPSPPAPVAAVAPPPPVEAPAAAARGPVDAFNPVAGAISLRVSPVAGFQGLMRVQDALVRIRGVREAGVEAYAQGEARLRLHLSAEMDADALAAALTELLGRPTRVAAASTSERTLQLVLE